MKNKRLEGSLTIEAALALPLFLLGFMVIISLVYIVQTESVIQYGVNQVTREISEYCYIADKLSLTSTIESTSLTTGDAVENVCGLSGLMDDTGEDSSESENAISSLINLILGERGDESVNGAATEAICRQLIPKFISGDRSAADKYLQALSGITIDDINFRYSSVLRDGQTVNIVAVYKVRLKTFGLIDKGIELTMRNSASTKAWLPESELKENEKDEDEEENSENENAQASKWLLLPCERGRVWIEQLKSENEGISVKSGHGVDLYRVSDNEFTEIFSINVFTKTYSECSSEGSVNPEDYSIKKNAVKNKIGSYADKMKRDINKITETLVMENETEVPVSAENRKLKILIIFPEEAKKNPEMVAAFEEIAEKTANTRSIKVEYMFREKALFTQVDEEEN